MNRRAFFCGLAVSPLAALASVRANPKNAEPLVVSVRLEVDDSGLVAFVEDAAERAIARSHVNLAGRLDDFSARHG